MDMDNDLHDYRASLLQTIQKLNESYDKLIITLSGGALALSLTFLKDIIKENQIQHSNLLIAAWVFLILSLASVLVSLLFGIAANEKAVKQVDDNTIYDQKPGGFFSVVTSFMHYAGTVFLIIGLILITTFTFVNMEVKDGKRQDAAQTTGKSSIPANVTKQGQQGGGGQEKLGTTTTSSTQAKTK